MKKLMISILTIVCIFSTSLLSQSLQEVPEAAKLYNAGRADKKLGQIRPAIEKFEAAMKLSDDYRIFYQLGVSYKSLNETEKAIEYLNKCIEAKADFFAPYNSLGSIYYISQNYKKALDAYRNYEKYAPVKYKDKAKEQLTKTLHALGVQAKSDGKFQDAVKLFEEAVSLNDYEPSFYALSEIYNDLQQFEKAIEAADKAINSRQKGSSIPKGAPYFYKGMAFKGLNNIDKARENLEIAKKDRNKDLRRNAEIELDKLR